MTPDDPISAALGKVRGNILKAEDAGMSRDLDGVIYTHGLMTGTSRRLLAVVDAVLKLHRPHPRDGGTCVACAAPDDEDGMASWPCPTVQAITRALTGEADDEPAH